MILDGLFGDTETVTNLSIGQPAEDPSRDFDLARVVASSLDRGRAMARINDYAYTSFRCRIWVTSISRSRSSMRYTIR